MLLQKLLLPKGESNVLPSNFYISEHSETVISELDCRSLFIQKGGAANLASYYNAFSISKWKMYTDVKDLAFFIKGNGKIRLGFYFIDTDVEPKSIFECDIEITESGVHLPISQYQDLKNGYLFVKIRALTDAVIYDNSGWETITPVNKQLKLGLVITHYNRKQHILPVLKKLSSEITSDPLLSQYVSIVVVDNSSNIEKCEIRNLDHIHLIHNANLGGSGGYARGLLHLKDNEYTHCLYTDDDVQFEPESIRRCLCFLLFGKDKKLSIVGSIFSEDHPYSCLQTGAKFYYRGWMGLNSGLNLSNINQLANADQSLIEPDYGAWPFFVFPIKEVSHFPFPYFVRGDDVLFGLQNNFKITSLNGVGITIGNINHREGPMSLYQDTRAILSINCFKSTGMLPFIKSFSHLFLCQLFSYKYGSAASVLEAFRDVCKGPDFFAKNIDCVEVRKKIKPFADSESFSEIKNNKPDDITCVTHESFISRLLRYITLNGVLLPNFILKKKSVLQIKSFRSVFRQIYLYEKVFYYCPYTKRYFIASLNRCQKAFKNSTDKASDVSTGGILK